MLQLMHAFEAKRQIAPPRGPSDLATPRTHAEQAPNQTPWFESKPPQGAGERLQPAVQRKMERSFGFDFSSIRIHQDDRAKSAGALAFAQGRNLHFAPGQYAPETRAGQVVLGHELAHVVQQAAGRVHVPAQALGGAINDDPELEREADKMGESAASGQPAEKAEQEAAPADEPLQSRLERLMSGNSAKQPIQRKVEVPPDTILPSFHKYLSKTGNVYSYDNPDRTKGNLSFEILTSLFNSPRVFTLQGENSERAEFFLMRHIQAREGVVDFAANKKYKFTGGRENFKMNPKYWWVNKDTGKFGLKDEDQRVEASKDLKANPDEYVIGCFAATKLTVQGGGDSQWFEGHSSVDQDWIPGEAGYIKNDGWEQHQRPGLEGENIIYMGGKDFWGHFENDIAVKTYTKWFEQVNDWDKAAKLQPDRNWPRKGLKT